MKSLKKIKSSSDIDIVFEEIRNEYQELRDVNFAANLLLKYSLYNKKCIEFNEDLVKVFTNFKPDFFIKYFMWFCYKHKLSFNPFLQYYNLGLMESNTKYRKFIEEQFSQHDVESLFLYLDSKNLSAKEFFKFAQEKKLDLFNDQVK